MKSWDALFGVVAGLLNNAGAKHHVTAKSLKAGRWYHWELEKIDH
jgi:hypothetical protein